MSGSNNLAAHCCGTCTSDSSWLPGLVFERTRDSLARAASTNDHSTPQQFKSTAVHGLHKILNLNHQTAAFYPHHSPP